MTEREWLACADPVPMLNYLEGKAGDRKMRLFAVACCGRVWPALTDERSRRAVELSEFAADHPVTEDELDTVSAEAEEAFEDTLDTDYYDGKVLAPDVVAAQGATHAASYASNSPAVRVSDAIEVAQAAADAAPGGAALEAPAQAALLRDIFGNPFRPVTFDTAWRTDTVIALARGMYESRDFGAMPILADALQDAGCTSNDILDHCRGPGPHVRGCWVVDLVLGKA